MAPIHVKGQNMNPYDTIGTNLIPGPNAKTQHDPIDRMTSEEFVTICTRLFGQGTDWKHRTASALNRKWNTVWCYADGRRPIPAAFAELLWELNRLMDEAMAKIAAQSPEESRRSFYETLDRISAESRKRPTHV
jgi:hypothetical protein